MGSGVEKEVGSGVERGLSGKDGIVVSVGVGLGVEIGNSVLAGIGC